ncbi:SNF-related serine/threonine-protein kinase-like [Sinocyclocheilus rhinocerous]|uniref:SNF-related serine/threonine-protein kinase n=1 Tax=Sinocyclocheilus rhinocerous TaxID=307959 RepID=A0A673JWU4_9TELE|nr:PREDICTED: SNF-related serine/threonine-protein kinase-like [Sinocyclocheilus rhinocerous]XP_016367055.1 PREDICTED: SNF-related serine/threonine-protein kinase-like [Sinocyclocheilus rhinocerous]XP_016367056.1 PREDICTED: SNF-related serine/threonine-protein kinase-like [Sinocyclocheilus rhinocerous]XP_016367057.1 PREDICTED: SNF-related serine/threonine-protein kinase-like [Sinocyclocheilus rhinocerous]
MAATKSGYEGKIAGLYDLDRTLGKGHFAVVKLARHVFTGQLVAVKVIDKTKLDDLATGHLLQEVRCMKLVQHPNVVRLYEVIDTQTKLYLILELGDGGDMYDYILRHEGGVAEDMAKVHFAQIVRAIAYCHRLHVVHRDLKPENVVFFRQQGTVKLTDFGFSNHFQPGTMLMTSCGSLAYSAPEILLGEEYDAPAVDIWSLGVILYMLVCGHPPFQEANDSETLIMIMDCRYTVPNHVSPECKDLISHMLQRDPVKRASLTEIESHPWLQGVDPSPSGYTAAPLTSHHSLLPEEHEFILQAMTSGSIADRDAIQEALEADRYNHITATYYLLGERLLREKQEQPSPSPEQRHTQRPMSEPLDLVSQVPRTDTLRGTPLGPLAPLGSLSSGFVRRGVSESGDLLAPKPNHHDNSFSDFCSTAPCLSLSLHPLPPDQPTVKSLGALQQICEEEEDEDDENEQNRDEAKLEVAPGKLDPLPSTDLLLKPSRTSLQSETQKRTGRPSCKVMRNCETVAEEEELEEGSEIIEEQKPLDSVSNITSGTMEHQVQMSPNTEAHVEELNHTEQPSRGKDKGVFTHPSLSLVEQEEEQIQGPNINGPPPPPRLDVVQCCWGQREPSKDTLENNNNTLAKSRLLEVGVVSTACDSPRSLPRNHCVDLGPDGVEMRKTAGEVEKPEEVQPKPQKGLQETRDTNIDPAIRADPSKVKNVNLRECLLQFPLCEKALSFNIQPTSKEKLLPFAQYNCCHVL